MNRTVAGGLVTPGTHRFPHQQLQERFLVGGHLEGGTRATVEIHLFSSGLVVSIQMAIDATFLDVVAFLQRKLGHMMLEDDGGTVLDVFVRQSPDCINQVSQRASLLWGGRDRNLGGIQMKLSDVLTLKEQQSLQDAAKHKVSTDLWAPPGSFGLTNKTTPPRLTSTITVVVSLGVERREDAARHVVEAWAQKEMDDIVDAFARLQNATITFQIHPSVVEEWAASTSGQRDLQEQLLLGSCIALVAGCDPKSLREAKSFLLQKTTAASAAAIEVHNKPEVWRQMVAALKSDAHCNGEQEGCGSCGEVASKVTIACRFDDHLQDILHSLEWWQELCGCCRSFQCTHGIGRAATGGPQLSFLSRGTASGTWTPLPHLESEHYSIASLWKRAHRIDGEGKRGGVAPLASKLVAPSLTIVVSVTAHIIYWRTRARVFLDGSSDFGNQDDGGFEDLSAAAPTIGQSSTFNMHGPHPCIPRVRSGLSQTLPVYPVEALAALEGSFVCFTRSHDEHNSSAINRVIHPRPLESSSLWWQWRVGAFLDRLGYQVRLGSTAHRFGGHAGTYMSSSGKPGPRPAAAQPSAVHAPVDGLATYESLVEFEASRISSSTGVHFRQQLVTLDGRWEERGTDGQQKFFVDVVPTEISNESRLLAKFLIHVRATGLLEEYRYPGLHETTRMVLLFDDMRRRWFSTMGGRGGGE